MVINEKQKTKRRICLLIVMSLLIGCTSSLFGSLNVMAADDVSRSVDETTQETPQTLVNVALNKTASINGSVQSDRPASMGVDGNKTDYHYYAEIGRDVDQTVVSPYYLQIDLEQEYDIEKLNLYRYWADSRTYHDTVILVSTDENFTESTTTVIYNQDTDNFFGWGVGTEAEYTETSSGKEIVLSTTVVGRYVRILNNGSSVGKGGHIVELEVYAYVPLTNVALEKSTSINGSVQSDCPGSYAVDGNKSSYYYYAEIGRDTAQTATDPYYLQIDLGQEYEVEQLRLYRYWADGRTYNDTVIVLSTTADFVAGTTTVVYNQDSENFFGWGTGTDTEYSETSAGKEILLTNAVTARYIRLLNNGSSVGQGCHIVELEAYALTDAEILPMPHADDYLSIPSFEATGKVDGMTHPDVIKFEEAWNGYLYWMAATPNQANNSQFENPCLVASNDGLNWVVPSGITNPLTGVAEEPTPYHNCDTDLVYVPEEDALYVYYVWSKDEPAYGTNGFAPSEVRMIKVSKDTEGWVIDEPIAVVTTTYRYDVLSPAIIRLADGTWKMWSVNTGDQGWNNQSNYIELRTSSDGINWSNPTSLAETFDQGGYVPWHIDVQYVSSLNKYLAVFPAYPDGGGSTYTELFYAESQDGVIWTTYDQWIMKPQTGSWDNSFIYRSTFLYDSTTDIISLWYAAGQSSGWQIAYTENTRTAMLAELGEAHTPVSETETWNAVSAFDGDVQFDEGWIQNPSDGSLGSAYCYTAGATAELVFYGTGIRWIGQYDVNFGTAIVTLDGVETEVDISQAANEVVSQGLILFEQVELAEGVHTITVEPKTTGVENQSGCVDLSGFEVLYNTTQTIQPTNFDISTSVEVIQARSATIAVRVEPYNASSESITWSSADTTIATVNNGGVVTGVAPGSTSITAVLGTASKTTQVTVQEPVEMRITVDNEHPLLIVPLYVDTYQETGSIMSWGNTLTGVWNNIPEDIRPYTLIEIHLGGFVGMGTKGNSTDHNDAKLLYAQQLQIAQQNNIPVGIVVATAGNVSYYTAADVFDAEWVESMLEQYSCLKALIITENYWTDYQSVANTVADYLPVAAEYGAYCIWSEHKTQVIEDILNNQTFMTSMEAYGDNLIFTWKNTPKADNGETASYMQGLWLTDKIAQWGGLSDTWLWFEKGYWKLFAGNAGQYGTGGEECRAVVSEPEALLGIQMLTIYNNGGCIYNFEHPAYVYGADNTTSPAFTNVVLETFRYAIENPAPSKAEILSKTEAIVHGNLSTISLHEGLNMDDETLPTYSTGRYGLIPAVPTSITVSTELSEIMLPISEITDDDARIAKFNQLYPQTYSGTAYAEEVGNAWIVYNSKVNENANQNAILTIGTQEIGITMAPHTFSVISETETGIDVYLNNYRVNKDSIWESYSSTSDPWNSDVDTEMEDWLTEIYFVSPDDNTFRETVYTLQNMAAAPTVQATRGLAGQYADIQVSYDATTQIATITVSSNGYIEFTIAIND